MKNVFEKLIEMYRSTIHFIKKPLLPFILYKMILKSFLFWFSIAQGLFVMTILIFDFFTKYITAPDTMSIFNIVYITLLYSPKAMWLSMPIAIMFGVIMSIANLYQNNELVAIFTSTISIYKFVVPLIVFNILLSLFMIFMDSYVVIPSFRYRENLYEFLTKTGDTGNYITIKGEDNYFWNVEEYVSSRNMLKNIIIIKISDDYRVIKRVDASSAIYTDDGWLFSSGAIIEWDNKGEITASTKFYKKTISELKEKPEIFRNVFKKSDYDIERMTINEAKERLKLLTRLNIEHNDELLKYYKKFSFPFTLLVVCLFAIGVSTLSQRNILILSLFFSIGLAIIYYIMQMILDVLASAGNMPPIVGAWLAIIIFLPVSIVLVKKAKT